MSCIDEFGQPPCDLTATTAILSPAEPSTSAACIDEQGQAPCIAETTALTVAVDAPPVPSTSTTAVTSVPTSLPLTGAADLSPFAALVLLIGIITVRLARR